MATENEDTKNGQTQNPSRVSREIIKKAVNSLLKWNQAQRKKRGALSHNNEDEDDQNEFLFLVINLKKIPHCGTQNLYRIPVPHPLFLPLDGTQDVCLIIDDREKSMNVPLALNKIKDEGLPISRVLKFSTLKSRYANLAAKRDLCESFDLFLVDERLISLVPRILGKGIFRKRKQPVPVDLKQPQWREQIQRACASVLLCTDTAKCYHIKVAWASQSKHEILENVFSVIEGLPPVISKNWKNITAMHLKFPESLALPLYDPVSKILDRENQIHDSSRGNARDQRLENDKIRKRPASLEGSAGRKRMRS